MPIRVRSALVKATEEALLKAGRQAAALPPKDRSKQIRGLVAIQAEAFLERRFSKIRSLRLTNLNLNIFLLRAVRDVYGLDTADKIIDYLVNATLRSGDETAYGWLMDLKILPLFGASTPPEREDPIKWEGYKEIDKEVNRPPIGKPNSPIRRHMVSVKAGPWTINDTMAREMHAHVVGLQQYGQEPVVYGVTYGHKRQLSNKPGIVKGDFDDEHVAVLVGQDFWDWLAGYSGAHLDVLNGIADGETAFAVLHAGRTIRQLLLEKKATLTKEFNKYFGVTPGGDLWEQIAKSAF